MKAGCFSAYQFLLRSILKIIPSIQAGSKNITNVSKVSIIQGSILHPSPFNFPKRILKVFSAEE
jgi:hypothetical protein